MRVSALDARPRVADGRRRRAVGAGEADHALPAGVAELPRLRVAVRVGQALHAARGRRVAEGRVTRARRARGASRPALELARIADRARRTAVGVVEALHALTLGHEAARVIGRAVHVYRALHALGRQGVADRVLPRARSGWVASHADADAGARVAGRRVLRAIRSRHTPGDSRGRPASTTAPTPRSRCPGGTWRTGRAPARRTARPGGSRCCSRSRRTRAWRRTVARRRSGRCR